jgi:hypothetical protein
VSALEASALAIVALYVIVRARLGPDPRRLLLRLGLLVVASWLCEDSCIRAYGFYAYSPRWSLFIDRVPLAIVLIWPVVIHSGWELCGYLLGHGHRLLPLAGAALIFADASLIEPVAVCSGLWRWTEPGLFAVPPIGILGWALYAGLAMAVLAHNARAGRRALADAAVLLVAPAGLHLLLCASWWGLLRWVSRPLPPWPAVAIVWAASLLLTGLSLGREARLRVPLGAMLLRAPAAAFFFGLLAINRDGAALVAYAMAFAPPYLSLMSFARARPAGPR